MYLFTVLQSRSDSSKPPEMKVTLEMNDWDAKTLLHSDMRHSTESEPEASIRLLGRATQLHPGCTSIYVGDHEPFTEANDRGYSLAPGYNARVAAQRTKFPTARFEYQCGEGNLADKFSRMKQFILHRADIEEARSTAMEVLSRYREMGKTAYCVVGSGRGGGTSRVYQTEAIASMFEP